MYYGSIILASERNRWKRYTGLKMSDRSKGKSLFTSWYAASFLPDLHNWNLIIVAVNLSIKHLLIKVKD